MMVGLIVGLCLAAAAYLPDRIAARQPAAQKVDFVRDIQPIFKTSCAPCHAGERPKAGLRLDNKALALEGGISGAVITP
jgi:mono/diheme cytochrome c family protein